MPIKLDCKHIIKADKYKNQANPLKTASRALLYNLDLGLPKISMLSLSNSSIILLT